MTVAAHQLLSRIEVPPLELERLKGPASRSEPTSPDAPVQARGEAVAETGKGREGFSVITFDVGGMSLALEARRIVEVATARPIRRVPHRTGASFLGLVNVRGRLEPCFSLAVVLGLPPERDPAERRLVVVGDERRCCAFHAQRVALREADLSLVGNPPATVSAALDTHVRGILRLADRPWSWLDADRLLASLERTLA